MTIENGGKKEDLLPLKVHAFSFTESACQLNFLLFSSGLFDKAKKKILGDRDDADDLDQSSKGSGLVTPQVTSLFDVDYWAPQEIGNVMVL